MGTKMKKPYRKSKTAKEYLAQRILTPFGVAQWAYLNSPQKIHDPDGTYKVDVVVPEGAELAEFRGTLQVLADAHREEYDIPQDVEIHIPIAPHVDMDGKETGKFAIRTKLGAVVKRDGQSLEQRPTVVDANTDPIVPVPPVGAGSILRVAADAISRVVKGVLYVTLNIQVVQIKELVEWDQASPENYGMGEVEGFVKDPTPAVGSGDAGDMAGAPSF